MYYVKVGQPCVSCLNITYCSIIFITQILFHNNIALNMIPSPYYLRHCSITNSLIHNGTITLKINDIWGQAFLYIKPYLSFWDQFEVLLCLRLRYEELKHKFHFSIHTKLHHLPKAMKMLSNSSSFCFCCLSEETLCTDLSVLNTNKM